MDHLVNPERRDWPTPPRTRGAARHARKLAGVVALAASLFLVASTGVLTRRGDDVGPGLVPPKAAPDGPIAPGIGGVAGLDDTVGALRARVESVPDDAEAWASLGMAYVQQARVRSDPAFYQLADEALQQSRELDPGSVDGLVAMSALASARHDFAQALEFGIAARRKAPASADVYGVVGDALVELGRYEQAFAAYQGMVNIEPGIGSYARASYALELQGDLAAATNAMERARSVAGTPSDVAWTSYHLGELRFHSGRIGAAARDYRFGLSADPEFLPNLAGLAKVAWARGATRTAVERFEEVVARFPAPEHVITLGDLYTTIGDKEDAAATYDLVRVQQQLSEANGVNTDLELALFDADHGRPQAAVAAARAEWDRRRSVHVADALAWALHAAGRDEEAARYARSALRLGTRTGLFLYHAAEIEHALGNDDDARALLERLLRTDPYFSVLHAGRARGLLDELS